MRIISTRNQEPQTRDSAYPIPSISAVRSRSMALSVMRERSYGAAPGAGALALQESLAVCERDIGLAARASFVPCC